MSRAQLLRTWTWDDASADPFVEIDGTSPAVRHLKQQMEIVARDPDVTVLLTGESGTGKERVARAIHDGSPRARAPFVVIDCAGISPSLAEDALFGHLRGAFTGALEDRAGPFERAAGGTVLLDEIGELSPDLQMKLLRAIQSRTVLRLGATRETPFDARIFAATNVDLEAAVGKGRFREDLFYRLDVYRIRLPALRDRGGDDLATLIETILERLCTRRKIRPRSIEANALALLREHRWPGNVRELENVVERMLVASGGRGPLASEHLPSGFCAAVRQPPDPACVPQSADELRHALARHGFRSGRTAAALGLSRHQLYRLARRHGVQLTAPAS